MAESDRESAQTFEKALARLEAIVRDMESGNQGLDKMMALFEEGTKLVGFCTTQLNSVEKKIELLVKQGNQTTTQPFDPAKDEND